MDNTNNVWNTSIHDLHIVEGSFADFEQALQLARTMFTNAGSDVTDPARDKLLVSISSDQSTACNLADTLIDENISTSICSFIFLT